MTTGQGMAMAFLICIGLLFLLTILGYLLNILFCLVFRQPLFNLFTVEGVFPSLITGIVSAICVGIITGALGLW